MNALVERPHFHACMPNSRMGRVSRLMTEDQRRILAAYKIALSMMRDRTPRKLLDLLNVLECRDLLRKERQEEIEAKRRAQLSGISE